MVSSRQRSYKALLEEGVVKTVAQIEELKTDIKSMRESLKSQRAEVKQVEKEITKLEAKKAKADAKAAEEAKKAEAESVYFPSTAAKLFCCSSKGKRTFTLVT